jgi:DNA-binding response OmpR family regulator
MMPGLDGFETCRRLSCDPKTAAIPIIFLTMRDDTASVVGGFEVGAADYVLKPFRHEEVISRVHLQLERPFLQSLPIPCCSATSKARLQAPFKISSATLT